MKTNIDLIITNSSKLITLKGTGSSAVTGSSMQDLGIIENGAVAVKDGKILETGSSIEIENKYNSDKIIDAKNNLVMPGLVDCHTHLVFGGSREYELGLKVKGATYLDILSAGGGINSTVEATRDIPEDQLLEISRKRIKDLLA